MLKIREMFDESELNLFREAVFTNDPVSRPEFIQALQESKRQGSLL